ncbi:MAG: NAD-binding protein [Syntrophaceae bacterium]|nr:NAD-binding protein [Syntrophaceae bacterium]
MPPWACAMESFSPFLPTRLGEDPKFFFAPWIEAESQSRAPRELPPGTKGHVILTGYDAISMALVEKLKDYKRGYVVICEDFKRALELYDTGGPMAVGNIDDRETYRKLRVENASLVVATQRDEINTNITLMVREVDEKVPIITTAESPYSMDILSLAGSSKVLQIYDILGRSLAGWTMAGDCRANIIGRFDGLVIAEFPAAGTPLVGKTIAESKLRENMGVTVVGIWKRGNLHIPVPGTVISRTNILVLAGSAEAMSSYEEVYFFYHICKQAGDPVLIVGGGRVGNTIAERFKEREIPYLIIEKNPRKAQEAESYVLGDAANIETLKKAWIEKAPAALITTHDDATNIYLTKYLRSLRPDMQIISRANLDRNVSTLHRAGADFVMSYSSLGANAIFNFLEKEDALMLAEGLTLFHLKAPASLVGKSLTLSRIREETGCSVVALRVNGVLSINPDPNVAIGENAELILMGSLEGERKFLRVFGV